jgi:type IV secretory pathway VirB6-like protein
VGNSNGQENESSKFIPEIRRGCFDVLRIYEVSESELEVLTQGSPNSIHLNFAIFLLSVSISFIIALLTTTIASNRVFIVFVVITVVGAIGGVFLLFLWFKTRKSVSDLVQTIKKRLPPEGIQEIEITTDH